mgnify:CR=1 FL=1
MGQQKQKCAATSAELKSTGKRKITVGSVWESKTCGAFEVINYINWRDVTVRFVDTGYIKKCQSSNVRSGSIKDNLSKKTYGVGFIGDGNYSPMVNGKQSEAYAAWNCMFDRCYSRKFQERNPSYIGCTVCPEWHNFQSFAKWFDENHPKDGGRYELDKDLKVIGNRVYSPTACLFVSATVNNFIIERRDYGNCNLAGVSFERSRGKFRATCQNPITKKSVLIGRFSSEIDAHMAWRNKKSKFAYELANEQESNEVRSALLRWKYALDNFDLHPIKDLMES